MSNHTPGPWNLDTVIDIIADVPEFSSQPEGTSEDDNVVVANARLIAAAPEMLAALKEIEEGRGPFSADNYQFACNTIEAMKEIARDAIAKAEGL